MGASSCFRGRKEQELAAGSRSHKLAPMGRCYGKSQKKPMPSQAWVGTTSNQVFSSPVFPSASVHADRDAPSVASVMHRLRHC